MQDDFNLDEFENNEEETITNKDKFNNVLSYIPFLNIWLLFNQKSESKKFNKRFYKQWITFFLLYIILFFIFSFLSFGLSFLFTFAYFISIIFFWAKAYNWIYIEINFIEKIISQFEAKK